MKQYRITGMSCAACSSRVEKAVSSVDGVTACSVNLLTNSMGVEGSAPESEIIKAVTDAGYGAFPKEGGAAGAAHKENDIEDTETPRLKRRLTASIGFLAVLMYISMGSTMLGAPLPGFMSGNSVMTALAEMILAAIVMVINQKFFISGFKGLIRFAPNMDTLVGLGSMSAFVYSLCSLFIMTNDLYHEDISAADHRLHGLYFESAAMILTLITVGKLLESRSKGRTTDALKGLMKLAPETAVIVREGKEIRIDVKEVRKGDIFIVKEGESIPVDGVVLEGEGAVDESALTGESMPVEKKPGSALSAASINTSGYLKCEATRVGEDTSFAQIIRLVNDASASKAPIAKIADRVSGIFVPAVISIAAVTFAVWLLLGHSIGFSLARAISVLVISCPCALGLATPVAITVGSGVGARNGILFKTAASLEETGKVKIAAFDKTGTITTGMPEVTDIIPADGFTEGELTELAYSLESKSGHPLAGAIVRYAESSGARLEELSDFKSCSGSGVTGSRKGLTVCGGNKDFAAGRITIPDDMTAEAEKMSASGKTPLYFTAGDKLAGIIAVADRIKPESREAINELKKIGIRPVMLTGDNELTAKAIAAEAGIEDVAAGLHPEDKEAVIQKLRSEGKVVMIGDGINDAPALTSADIGIAIGAGTDVAIDSADVVLMKSSLYDVPAAVKLSRAALRNIKQNLFWAFIYNIIGIPLAAGVYINLLGWEMNPMFGAAAMSLSSFCVVTNALRLNFFKAGNSSNTGDDMITIKIKGMMCGHCEARVRKALEELEGVTSAEVSYKQGTAVVRADPAVSDEALLKAVTDAGYRFKSIKKGRS